MTVPPNWSSADANLFGIPASEQLQSFLAIAHDLDGSLNARYDPAVSPRPQARPMMVSSGVGSSTLPSSYRNAGFTHCAGILTWASSQTTLGGPVDIVSAIPSPLSDQSLKTQY